MFSTTIRKKAAQRVYSAVGKRYMSRDTPKVFLSNQNLAPSTSSVKLSSEAMSMDEDTTRILIDNNNKWVNDIQTIDPNFFQELAMGQSPEFFYIGCSDSRVPPEQMLGLGPGDVFVYRNIANQIHVHDISVQAAIQFAVEVLKVKSVLVCGHYGCGGIRCSTERPGVDRGILEQWLQVVRSIISRHKEELSAIKDEDMMLRRLVEINVIEQCINVYRSGPFQRTRLATANDERSMIPLPRVHPLVFDLGTGKVKKLVVDWPKVMASLGEVYDLYDFLDEKVCFE
jgi:carbonic anhydrase